MKKSNNKRKNEKIDLIQLDKLLREGKRQIECAEYFGVSQAAVSKAKKLMKTHIVRTVAMEKTGQVMEAHLDILGQLRSNYQMINLQLDRIVEMANAATSIKDVTTLQDMIVKLAGEVRKTVNSFLDITETFQNIVQYEKDRDLIFKILDKFQPGVRNEAISEIKRMGLLSGNTEID